MRSVIFAIYDLCPYVVRTQEVKEMMFNLANASPEGKETIFKKQTPYSEYTPYFLLSAYRPSSLSCLCFLIFLPH